MYVCLCNGIRETELRQLAREGVRDVKTAYARLDSELVCQYCLEEAQMVLNDEKILEAKPAHKSTPRLSLVG